MLSTALFRPLASAPALPLTVPAARRLHVDAAARRLASLPQAQPWPGLPGGLSEGQSGRARRSSFEAPQTQNGSALLAGMQLRSEALRTTSVQTILSHVVEYAVMNPGKPLGNAGVLYKAIDVWNRSGRHQDAIQLARVVKQMEGFFTRFWPIFQPALERWPTLRMPLLNEGIRLAEHAATQAVGGHDPLRLLQGLSTDSVSAQAQARQLSGFHARAASLLEGAAPNASQGEKENLFLGNLVLRTGKADLVSMLRLIPAGTTKYKFVALDRELVVASAPAPTVTLMDYPPAAGHLRSVAWHDPHGARRSVMVARKSATELEYSLDEGRNWIALGNTSDALERVKADGWFKFMDAFRRTHRHTDLPTIDFR